MTFAEKQKELVQDMKNKLKAASKDGLIGAFSDQGEVVTMSPGDLSITFSRSGTHDQAALRMLITRSRTFSELADDPHEFALALWRSS